MRSILYNYIMKSNDIFTIKLNCYFRFGEHLDRGSFTTMNRSMALDLLDWAHRSQNIEDGSDNWMETSGTGSLEYHECAGDYTTVWKRGYSVLFDILMVGMLLFIYLLYTDITLSLMMLFQKNIPKTSNGLRLSLADRIQLNSPVHLIRWNSGQVQVVCSNQTYYADMVLVTCSLGVLKDRADKLFTPLLPEKKRRAIEVSNIND